MLEIESGLDLEATGLPATWTIDPVPPPSGVSLATVVVDPSVEALQITCAGPTTVDWAVRGVPIVEGAAFGHQAAGAEDGEVRLLVDGLDDAELLLVVVATTSAATASTSITCEIVEDTVAGGSGQDPPMDASGAGGCHCTVAERHAGVRPLLLLTASAFLLVRRRCQ